MKKKVTKQHLEKKIKKQKEKKDKRMSLHQFKFEHV